VILYLRSMHVNGSGSGVSIGDQVEAFKIQWSQWSFFFASINGAS
jgi:hypothetical protein